MNRDLDFEKFVKTNLGDIAVWDTHTGRYISVKIALYLTVWNKAKSMRPTAVEHVISGIDVFNHYESDTGMFSINRENSLRVICEHFNHTSYKRKV